MCKLTTCNYTCTHNYSCISVRYCTVVLVSIDISDKTLHVAHSAQWIFNVCKYILIIIAWQTMQTFRIQGLNGFFLSLYMYMKQAACYTIHTGQVSRFRCESHGFEITVSRWLRNFSRISIKTKFTKTNTLLVHVLIKQ